MVKNIFTKTNLILLREAIKSFLMKFPTLTLPLHEKCPNTKFFLVRISPHLDWIRRDTYSVWMQENTDQKKLRIWTLFTQCYIIHRRILTIKINLLYIVRHGGFPGYLAINKSDFKKTPWEHETMVLSLKFSW